MTTFRLNDCGHGVATVERTSDGLLSLVDLDPHDSHDVLMTTDLLRALLRTLNAAQVALNALEDFGGQSDPARRRRDDLTYDDPRL